MVAIGPSTRVQTRDRIPRMLMMHRPGSDPLPRQAGGQPQTRDQLRPREGSCHSRIGWRRASAPTCSVGADRFYDVRSGYLMGITSPAMVHPGSW
jgi:hypothetical protein